MGEMHFRLSRATPQHRKNFIRQVKTGVLDSGYFNRLVGDFVIQGGCPDHPDGSIHAQSWINAEFVDSLTHRFGALGMGRDENAQRQSADCQFYLVSNLDGLPQLDGRYTVFGQLIRGEDVLIKLNELAKRKRQQDSIAYRIYLDR